MSTPAREVTAEMPNPPVFTDSAAAKVRDLIAEEGNPALMPRGFVPGGRRPGFQVGLPLHPKQPPHQRAGGDVGSGGVLFAWRWRSCWTLWRERPPVRVHAGSYFKSP